MNITTNFLQMLWDLVTFVSAEIGVKVEKTIASALVNLRRNVFLNSNNCPQTWTKSVNEIVTKLKTILNKEDSVSVIDLSNPGAKEEIAGLKDDLKMAKEEVKEAKEELKEVKEALKTVKAKYKAAKEELKELKTVKDE